MIADSSPVYKKMFTQIITETRKESVIDFAADGFEALEFVKNSKYDIVIIDVEIPGLDLIKLLKEIISLIPEIFIMITARPSSNNNELMLEALSKGAAEYLIKPIYDSYNKNLEIIKRRIADIIKLFNNDSEKKINKTESEPEKIKKIFNKNEFNPELVLIAASTGGPRALEAILPKLKSDFPVPVLIVQHISAHFINTLAK
ncbi:MAG: response regulator, partial [Treponema sp.]|nr:response regulator [Treponema sp.]